MRSYKKVRSKIDTGLSKRKNRRKLTSKSNIQNKSSTDLPQKTGVPTLKTCRATTPNVRLTPPPGGNEFKPLPNFGTKRRSIGRTSGQVLTGRSFNGSTSPLRTKKSHGGIHRTPVNQKRSSRKARNKSKIICKWSPSRENFNSNRNPKNYDSKGNFIRAKPHKKPSSSAKKKKAKQLIKLELEEVERKKRQIALQIGVEKLKQIFGNNIQLDMKLAFTRCNKAASYYMLVEVCSQDFREINLKKDFLVLWKAAAEKSQLRFKFLRNFLKITRNILQHKANTQFQAAFTKMQRLGREVPFLRTSNRSKMRKLRHEHRNMNNKKNHQLQKAVRKHVRKSPKTHHNNILRTSKEGIGLKPTGNNGSKSSKRYLAKSTELRIKKHSSNTNRTQDAKNELSQSSHRPVHRNSKSRVKPSLRNSRNSNGKSQKSLKSRSSNTSRKTLPKILTEKLEFKKSSATPKQTKIGKQKSSSSTKKVVKKKPASNLRKVRGSLKKIRRVESSPLTQQISRSPRKRPVYKPSKIKETPEESNPDSLLSFKREEEKAEAQWYLESPSFRDPNAVITDKNVAEDEVAGTENILLQDKKLVEQLKQEKTPIKSTQNTISQNSHINENKQEWSVAIASRPHNKENYIQPKSPSSSLKKELIDVEANSSTPNKEEDEDLCMIEEVSRTIRKICDFKNST